MQNDMTSLFASGPLAARWLLVESPQYIRWLCKHQPNARITAVTRYEEIPVQDEFCNLPVDWHILDYRREKLPFAEESFDYAVAEPLLTEAWLPYETLLDLSRRLTDIGVLYAAYDNIRYHGILEQLREGIFPVRETHLYAKAEIVRLLDDTLFKEIQFLPGLQDDDLSEGQAWEAQGFDNFSSDLSTAKWLITAARSTARVANLKSLYDRETRKQLARILHRIEYDIDRQENIAALKKLCAEKMIFDEYLADFIQEACVHKEKLIKKDYSLYLSD